MPPVGLPGLLSGNRGLSDLRTEHLGSSRQMDRLDRHAAADAATVTPQEPPPEFACPVSFPEGSHFRMAPGQQDSVTLYSNTRPLGVCNVDFWVAEIHL